MGVGCAELFDVGLDQEAVLHDVFLPRIDAALKSSDVVVDGLYSWEESLLLRDCYGECCGSIY